MHQPPFLLALTGAIALVLGFVGGALFASRCMIDYWHSCFEAHEACALTRHVHVLEFLYRGNTDSAITRLQMYLNMDVPRLDERRRKRRPRQAATDALKTAAEFRARHPWKCGVPVFDERAERILGSYQEPPAGVVQ